MKKIFIICSLLMLQGPIWARIVYRGQKNTFIQFADYEPRDKYGFLADLVIVRCTYAGPLVEAVGLEEVYYAYFFKDSQLAFKIVSGKEARMIFKVMKREHSLQGNLVA